MGDGDILRIGCGGAFWGDSAAGPAQLLDAGGVDVIIMDYLAEITMSILARMKARDADAGYATDFVDAVMARLVPRIAADGVRVVTNAGGINPAACKRAVEALAREAGVRLRVAAVEGDDLLARAAALRESGLMEMTTGAPLPERLASFNAYLGAAPIAAALDAGADVVITGRCVDSALALGPLMHAFGWAHDDYDRLAAGSLAGHLLECGTQVTGGLFTDWEDVPGWDDMGFPVAECRADGTFELTKPAGTGGLVTPATVAEQLVYEIGDPADYVLPDVRCDFSDVRLAAVGHDRVAVSGARGRAPGAHLKACATYVDGYRATATMMIGGRDAARKATRVAEAVLARTRRLFAEAGHGDYRDVSVEVLGAESTYGPHAQARATREVVLKLAVSHAERAALEHFAREIYPAGTAMAPGLTGFAGGRPSVQPVVRLWSGLVPRELPDTAFELDGERHAVPARPGGAPDTRTPAEALDAEAAPAPDEATVTVPLAAIAHGRSGDKGDSANIGLIARHPKCLPVIAAQVTEHAVGAWFAHCVDGPVTRYAWPGIDAFNFVLERALGGGGTASLRYDPQGKAYAQMLLDLPVHVPADWVDADGRLHDTRGP